MSDGGRSGGDSSADGGPSDAAGGSTPDAAAGTQDSETVDSVSPEDAARGVYGYDAAAGYGATATAPAPDVAVVVVDQEARQPDGDTDDRPDAAPLFGNQLPERLEYELDVAESRGVLPTEPGTPEFDRAIDEADVMIWALLDDGRLVAARRDMGPDRIHHSVLSGGDPVVSAGEAEIAGSREHGYLGLRISNQSGHFMPSDESLDRGLRAFEERGITFTDDSIEYKGDG